ncbi:MAG: hypothetical protein PHX83_08455 [Acidobacteriia bacterium]|nr:hypothetical protein [Terriglobia bacterium]
MNCQEFKDHMTEMALEEMSAEARRPLEQHAAECAQCGLQWKQVRQIPALLRAGWPEETLPRTVRWNPEVAEPGTASIWQWLAAAPRWMNWSAATAAAVVILFAGVSLARLQIQYGQGRLTVAFGGSVSAPVSSTAPSTSASLSPADVEKLINSKYAELNAQERQEYAASLDRLAQQMQAQREGDLRKIGDAFDQVKNVMWKQMQRNDAIVQYAAQRIVTNSKN